MTHLEALLYGAVQGITEYLPISSSAHLILLPQFLGTEDPGLTFDVFLHLGTLFSTLIYFWKDWLAIFASIRRTLLRGPAPASATEVGVPWLYLVYATVPALIAGAAFHSVISTSLRGHQVTVFTLVIGGLALWLTDRLCAERRGLGAASAKDAWVIGLIQCLALVPGISRSGSTMTAGRLLQFDRASAARFSFLISAPITAAAIVFELRHWQQLLHGPVGLGPLLVAGVSSFVFGMLAIGGLLRVVKRFGYFSFALYRCALAVAIVVYLGF